MRRENLIVLAIVTMGVAILGSSVWTPGTPVQAAGATVTVPGDFYAPAAITIEVGQTVTWVNKDSDKHTATTVPGVPEVFTLPAYPGKSVSFKFTKPGIYPYYCLEHATYDPKLHRAVARTETDAYPIAMEGLIVVKGPGFTGSPAATIHIAGSAYSPDIAVVEAGGKVTWTNADTDAHAIAMAPGGPETTTLALPAGKSQTVTFSKPGIYLFYDERRASYDSKTALAKANKGTTTFPVSMQGFVIVL